MAKILGANQDYSIGHFVETFHLLDDKLDSTTANASNASTTAGSALSAALEATTNATQALNTAVNAQNTAQNSVDRLAGDGDYFIGYWTLPNVAETDNAPPAMVSVLNQGITWITLQRCSIFPILGGTCW